jgi:uncharacterized protein (DUF433 family)
VTKEFVEHRDGSFYLTGSRVPLALIVQEYQRGESPETIRSHFPTLTLDQVYGAIAFYLGHQSEVNQDLTQRESTERQFVNTAPPELKEKLDRAHSANGVQRN